MFRFKELALLVFTLLAITSVVWFFVKVIGGV